jgi:hypothetical protein
MSEVSERLEIIYNTLLSVEAADEVLKINYEKDAVLHSLGRIIAKFDLQDRIGISLLHRHNNISNEQMMCEDLETLPDGRQALSTIRVDRNLVGKSYIPAIWKASEHGPIAIEFTNANFFTEPFDSSTSDRNKAFVEEFSEEVSGKRVAEILGFCLLNRALSYNRELESLCESIDVRRCANVVVVKDKTLINPATHIETTWEFIKRSNMVCDRNCCNNCVWRSPGHDVSHKHSWHAGDD